MGNPTRGTVTFEADGTTYSLSYSVNALCELEEAAGEGVTQIAARMSDPQGLRLAMVRNLFWAGLRDHHPEVTVAETGRLMDAVGMSAAGELVARAFVLAFPQAEKAAARPLGRESGRRTGSGRTSARAGPRRASTLSSSGA